MNKFRYDQFLEFPKANGFYAMPRIENPYWLEMIPSMDKRKETGWKFHLSVDKQDVPAAWNIVSELMQKLAKEGQSDGKDYRLQAKVVTAKAAEDFSKPEEPQRGKMIVLYEKGDFPVEVWQKFLSQVEQKFVQEGIRPGLSVIGDNPVKGSKFAAYRNDQDEKGRYLAAAARDWRTVYRPEGDKFAGMVLDQNQDLGLLQKLNNLGKAVWQDIANRLDRPAARLVKDMPKVRAPIEAALNKDIRALEMLKISRIAREDNIESAAANPKAWEMGMAVGKRDGSGTTESVVRTIPGLFDPQQLKDLKTALSDNGFESRVQESHTTPGAFYLAIAADTRIQSAVLKAVTEVLKTRGSLMLAKGVPSIVASNQMAWQTDRVVYNPETPGKQQLVVRTVPGMFEEKQLGHIKDFLAEKGYNARVQESATHGGKFYLAIPSRPGDQKAHVDNLTSMFKELAEKQYSFKQKTAVKTHTDTRTTQNTSTC